MYYLSLFTGRQKLSLYAWLHLWETNRFTGVHNHVVKLGARHFAPLWTYFNCNHIVMSTTRFTQKSPPLSQAVHSIEDTESEQMKSIKDINHTDEEGSSSTFHLIYKQYNFNWRGNIWPGLICIIIHLPAHVNALIVSWSVHISLANCITWLLLTIIIMKVLICILCSSGDSSEHQ